jgi:hypothetical protein
MPPRLHVPYTVLYCFVALDFFRFDPSKTNYISLIPDAIVEENSNAIFSLLKRCFHFANGNFRRRKYFCEPIRASKNEPPDQPRKQYPWKEALQVTKI